MPSPISTIASDDRIESIPISTDGVAESASKLVHPETLQVPATPSVFST
jgi:hypothetical protein